MSEGIEGAAASVEAPVAAAPVAAEGADVAALAAAAAAAPAAAETKAAAVAEIEVDLDNDAADDIYSDPAKAKAYAKKLRDEAAANRVKAKDASSAFEGWSESDAAYLKDVIKAAAADPKVGAAKMREIAAALDGGDVEGAAAIAADASDAAEKVALTADDVDARVKEALDAKDKEAQISAKAAEIMSFAKDNGYEVTDDNPDYFALLHVASTQTAGDLPAAHAIMEARKQAVIDGYLADKKAEAAGSPRHVGRGDAAVIDVEEPNNTLKTARGRLEGRIASLRS